MSCPVPTGTGSDTTTTSDSSDSVPASFLAPTLVDTIEETVRSAPIRYLLAIVNTSVPPLVSSTPSARTLDYSQSTLWFPAASLQHGHPLSVTRMAGLEYLGRRGERGSLKHWPLVVLLPVLVAPFAIFGGFHKKNTDFAQCKQRFIDSEVLHARYNWTGPIEHLPPGVLRGFHITLQGCKDECGQWPDFYDFSVLPLFGLILQAPFFSHEFIDTVRTLYRWLGNPMSSISATIWNIHVTRKCAIVVDMMIPLNFKKPGQLVDMDGFWAMRDSIFLLSVINQYNINKNRLFHHEGATELLMRKALFLPALKNVRAGMADRIRRDGRQSVVPLFISLLWFAISIALSIFQAFGDLGANATAHNLAMGLLMAWLPVFATASIVDRNPSDADYVRDQLNDLFKAVERAQTGEVTRAIVALKESSISASTFQREWVRRVVKLAEKPQVEEVREKLDEELHASASPFASRDEVVPEAWTEPLVLWAREVPLAFGRHPSYPPTHHPTVPSQRTRVDDKLRVDFGEVCG
ncbi:13122_t:CDS:2 [Acaulospora colombiana]|uniref:13122_t:CDS:1 n=1 Tax=Acaulospora colombiana TaxID=27376 RepID=A0ACA9MV06_9GLOM|nr:13122_t:CDS:2 [Acaulospora colombiana]